MPLLLTFVSTFHISIFFLWFYRTKVKCLTISIKTSTICNIRTIWHSWTLLSLQHRGWISIIIVTKHYGEISDCGLLAFISLLLCMLEMCLIFSRPLLADIVLRLLMAERAELIQPRRLLQPHLLQPLTVPFVLMTKEQQRLAEDLRVGAPDCMEDQLCVQCISFSFGHYSLTQSLFLVPIKGLLLLFN